VSLGSKAPAANGNLSGLSGAVTLIGGNGVNEKDVLNVDDTGTTTGHTGMINATALTGLGLPGTVLYSGFESADINLGAGDDTFTRAGGSAAYTVVKPGKGHNTVI
jgi:hypothetical protein